MIYKDHFVPE